MTIILQKICIFIFAVAYFFNFRLQYFDDDLYRNDGATLLRCFLATLNYGERLSGGSGDHFRHLSDGGRVAVDLLYWWVVLIVMLNVVFGIILNNFGT
jgi:inositol 1,4,5-triphosphate receptor type 3